MGKFTKVLKNVMNTPIILKKNKFYEKWWWRFWNELLSSKM